MSTILRVEHEDNVRRLMKLYGANFLRQAEEVLIRQVRYSMQGLDGLYCTIISSDTGGGLRLTAEYFPELPK